MRISVSSWATTGAGVERSLEAIIRLARQERATVRFQRPAGGLIHERRQIDDMLGMLTQLGVVPM